MLPDQVSNPGPLTYESGALQIALHSPATREFILGQVAYTLKCNSCNASMQHPVSLTFIHDPVILPYFKYYLMD